MVPERTAAQRLGDSAEGIIAERLTALGWDVLARNLRVGRHELDLLAVDPGPPRELVALEVRWRGRRDFGLPEESINWAKRRALRRALVALRERLPAIAPSAEHLPIRVDLIAMEPAPPGSPEPFVVRHHRAVALG